MKRLVIVIGGKEYPCRLTLGAMRRFKRETGKDVSKLQNDDIDGLITLMWCCTLSACNADHIEFGISLDDFADAIEPDRMNDFVKEMSEGAGDDTKKKTE